jgi:hypothetical protein
MKTFWLSFADSHRPKGQQFLGVAVIDVSDDAAAAAKVQLELLFPKAQPDAEWILAATLLAWEHDCNPGGEVGAIDITDDPEVVAVPRNRLLSKEELTTLELI